MGSQPETERVEISGNEDLVTVRARVRKAASEMGFSHVDTTRLMTAASELARNIRLYAGEGTLLISRVSSGDRTGLRLKFMDQGPGIADIDQAMRDGYTTSRGLGKGLPGTRRLVDEFQIESEYGKGTTIEITKWVYRARVR